ncbi:unnamed protein product [Rotaria sordida]|uniref:ADP ribosyltransferase domain-containing protein n=1 Tax=Rotaria sordida TaxID=392033 RepID=A0A814M6Z0_9BILA|nr:unnamed protein product [Rotaria sordida]
MYTKLLKEILLKLDYDEHQKKHFIALSRDFYDNNTNALQIVDEFERDYQSDASIWWYTRPCFLHQMLNRALRMQDVETVIIMGFFLRDLHQKIDELYSKSNPPKSFIVYRGQAMSNNDFEKLCKCKGGLFSFNSFLSTSRNRQVSLMFAESNADNPNMKGVLFVMRIDTINTNVPFISLDGISYYEDEKEILFSMQTVFRIGDVKKIENEVWQVDLTLTSDDDQQLKILSKHMIEDLDGGTTWQQLGHLMYKMGQFKKGEEIYQMLLNITSVNDEDQITILYQMLGILKCKKGHLRQALSFFQTALDIRQNIVSSNHSSLAILHSNIGAVQNSMGEYSAAITSYNKALDIVRNSEQMNYANLATIYSNIGAAYRNMGEYPNARSYYEKALEIRKQHLPLKHPELAHVHINIGTVCGDMGNYSDSLENHKEGLELLKKSLPSNHPDLAVAFSCLGSIFLRIRDHSNAILYYKEALKIFEKSEFSDHPDLAILFNNIGTVYFTIGDYARALSHYEKGLNIRLSTEHQNYIDLAANYNNIALV